MKLDLSKLTNRRSRIKDGKQVLIARCPACAEEGHDRAGEHLIVFQNGRFACVLHTGDGADARRHRRSIWRLAGHKGADASKPYRRRYTPKATLASFPASVRILGRVDAQGTSDRATAAKPDNQSGLGGSGAHLTVEMASTPPACGSTSSPSASHLGSPEPTTSLTKRSD